MPLSRRTQRVLHYVAVVLGLALRRCWSGMGRGLRCHRRCAFRWGAVYAIIPVSGVFMMLRYLLILHELIAGRDYRAPDIGIKNA